MRRVVKRYTVLLEFRIAPRILPGRVWSVPTVCVCGAWRWGGRGLCSGAEKGMRTTWVVYLSICGRSAIYRKIGFADISLL